jgi:ABC-type Fe3+-hydroxamate transport system substrate-binding protein
MRRTELRAAENKIQSRPIRVVYYSEGYLFTAGTVLSELMGRAGLIDAAAEFGLVEFVQATPALMDNLAPDIILVGEDSAAAEADTMAMFRQPQFQIIDAVRNGRIYAIPGIHITTVSHNIVDAIKDIQALPID